MRDFAGQAFTSFGNETVALRNQSVPTVFELAGRKPLAWFLPLFSKSKFITHF
jgi:hypothetical protein